MMCETCGCSDGATARIVDVQTGKDVPVPFRLHGGHEHMHADGTRHSHPQEHGSEHDHGHIHAPPENRGRTVVVEASLLAKNDAIAARNRAWFAGREVLALNLMSSPGAGKTR